ncbi:MAG TPA: 50S ribosomal protein L4 [Dehalococcoidia bacterium]|nr:50S ribosomal protein L4 [Dehalococcoidia bacterium]
MKLSLIDAAGKEVKKIDVADEVFGVEPNRAVLHQVYVAQMNARRSGVANTKTRGEVRGSSAKVRRQKGLGRARIGTIRSPVLTGGGVAFGPKTRSYSQVIPKRIKRLAIRSALSAKVVDGDLHILDAMPESPTTKGLSDLLNGIGVERSSLLVTAAPDSNVRLSARNLRGASVIPANHLNVADILNHHSLVMTTDAVRVAEALWGGERATNRRAAASQPAVEARTEAPAKPARRRAPAKKVEQPTAAKAAPKRRAARPKAGEES